MRRVGGNRDGIPDFVEGMFSIPAQAVNMAPSNLDIASPGHVQSPDHAQHKSRLATSTIESESSSNWLLILGGIVLSGLCLVAALAVVWYFFLR